MNKPKMQMPCPFCGSDKTDIKRGGHKEAGGMYVETCQAFCKECHARGPQIEIRNFEGRPISSDSTRKYLAKRAQFFFGHGYLDCEDTNDWMITRHGDIIREDKVPSLDDF